MKLGEYLKDRKISHEEFGKLIGVSQVAISRYVNGQRVPRHTNIEAIAKATEGAVSPNDFFDCAAPTDDGDDASDPEPS